jgi:aspartate aminotransferase
MGRLQSQLVSHPSSISQKAAIEALTGPQDSIEMMRLEFQKRRDLVCSLMREIPGISFTEPRGAFYVFFKIESYLGKSSRSGKQMESAYDICEMLLEQESLALVSGDAFGEKHYMRLSFAASEQDIREGVARLKKGLASLA